MAYPYARQAAARADLSPEDLGSGLTGGSGRCLRPGPLVTCEGRKIGKPIFVALAVPDLTSRLTSVTYVSVISNTILHLVTICYLPTT